MNARRFAVYLGVSLVACFASIALYVLATERSRRKKSKDDKESLVALNFPFLTDAHCIEFVMNSKVMFIMRGLPGSGKSVVAHQIKQVYGDKAVVCSADDFRVTDQGDYVWKAEEYEMTHMLCQEKANQACLNATPVVIIDNTNIKKFLLFQYVSIAHDTGYRVVIVEPKTSWKLSISELSRRNHHNVTEERLRELLSEFDKVFALYYGWFLSGASSKTLKDRMLKVLRDCCKNIPSFQNSFVRDSPQEKDEPTSCSLETDLPSLSCLEHLRSHNLHITTFFYKRGQTQKAREYACMVEDAFGSVATLSIVAWTITPRTVAARVKLTSQQIRLWGGRLSSMDSAGQGGGDGNTVLILNESSSGALQTTNSSFIPASYKDLVIKPTVGDGDTAHVTLSCRSDITPVQGRYDLRDFITLELTNHSYEEYKVTDGIVRSYGDGQWSVYLNEPIHIDGLFTGFYGS